MQIRCGQHNRLDLTAFKDDALDLITGRSGGSGGSGDADEDLDADEEEEDDF